MSTIDPIDLRVDIGEAIAGEGPITLAMRLYVPPSLDRSAPVALFCIPGGGHSGLYFDLRVEDDDSFSFARQMAARGFIVVTIDTPGVGNSTRPANGYALTPDVLADAMAAGVARVAGELRTGRMAPALPALPNLVTIGVGHSLGGLFTIVLQARHALHQGIAVLGFGMDGAPAEFINERARAAGADPARLRAELIELAREHFDEPYWMIRSTGRGREIYGGGADRRALAVLKEVAQPLLAVSAMLAMVPSGVRPDAAQIEVPVFLGVGDRDMGGPPHGMPASYPASADVTLVVLPQTGHSHFAFPTTGHLCRRLASWARGVAEMGP
jgi:pimeloyl-ACP methyl ester carboxylesterase